MQAVMFNRMCSVKSSEMSIDKSECKGENDDQSQSLELFDNELWKDPILDPSKNNYDSIFHNAFNKSHHLLSEDSLL